MKTSKFVGLASALTMLASLAAIPASATHININTSSVSYEMLTEALETDAGVTVPAGSIAVTASIDNNAGFIGDTVTLRLNDDCTVVTSNDGQPIMQKGSVYSDALISAAMSEDNDVVSISGALTSGTYADGDLFTIYISSENTENFDNFVEIVPTLEGSMYTGNLGNVIQPNHYFYGNKLYYIGGDCNDNDIVNASDAAIIMSALANNNVPNPYEDENVVYNPSAGLNVITIHNNGIKDLYIPSCYVFESCDTNGDGYIYWNDAQIILTYAACHGVGNAYVGEGMDRVGQMKVFPQLSY